MLVFSQNSARSSPEQVSIEVIWTAHWLCMRIIIYLFIIQILGCVISMWENLSWKKKKNEKEKEKHIYS